MILKENIKDLMRNPVITYRMDAIEAFFNLINYEFSEVKSYNELDKNEKKLITENQFNYLFGSNE